jgi:hypothetical protein
LTISGRRLYQFFKYAIYAFLAANVYLFYTEESAAAVLQFPEGVSLGQLREAYSATIDTLAWVVLLLMFELETWILDDRHFTKPVVLSLHGLRATCYIAIVFAFVGYVDNMLSATDVFAVAGISDLCRLPPGEWHWALTLDEYVPITASNCASLSDASSFVQFRTIPAIVDAAGQTEIARLAWVDVINGAVWILVVLVLEFDVRLQERNLLEGLALRASAVVKFVLYSMLLLAAIYWGFKGGFLDFWDAFLWLVAFVFIEMNVFEWRAEDHAAVAAGEEDFSVFQ